MNGNEILRLVNQMHQDRNIGKEVIFGGIESAIKVAAERHAGVLPNAEPTPENAVEVTIDRHTGDISATRGGKLMDPGELGRIAAQSAKQLIIQKIREAEGDTVHQEYSRLMNRMVSGLIQRIEAGTAIVSLGKAEAILPRSESIPGETHHVNERVKAVIIDVKRQGPRVKIVLSRRHPDFVRSLFEQDIPEIQDHTIEIRAVAREPGQRSKVAVSSIDMKVDCVGACVGVRGSRIKNIIEELSGERIDIVRWNDSLQVLIPNALQPATISEVFTYPRLGRAIVLVEDDQLSLAIGRRGQNVRLASKLIRWDIEIMTHGELGETLEKAERWFRHLPGISEEAVQVLIEEGFLSYTDITFLETADLAEMVGVTEEVAEEMSLWAEEMAEKIEKEGDPFAPPPAEEGAEGEDGEVAEGEAPAEGDIPAEAEPSPEGEIGEAPADESGEAADEGEPRVSVAAQYDDVTGETVAAEAALDTPPPAEAAAEATRAAEQQSEESPAAEPGIHGRENGESDVTTPTTANS